VKNDAVEDRCGAKRIADERERQIAKEGWTSDHDDEHEDRSLVFAAISYAAPGEARRFVELTNGATYVDPWPESWDAVYDKRAVHEKTGELVHMNDLPLRDQIRSLEKAGALIAAEIDRLLRQQRSED
jgi:hypothetical protein